jgi:hypothetical protein
MLPILCEVVPRPDATAEDLKALGSGLLRWYVTECANGLADSADMEALIDLLNGRWPGLGPDGERRRTEQTVTRYLGGYEMPLPTLAELRAAMDEPARPAVRLWVSAAKFDRRHAVSTLRLHVASDLVEDVRVGGLSWSARESYPTE